MSLHMTKDSSYQDRNGDLKTFTTIDWSSKTKVGFSKMGKKELEEINKELESHKESIAKAILGLPAVNAPAEYNKLKDRSPEKGTLTWNVRAVLDICLIDDQYARNLFNIVWKRTMPEDLWSYDMSYEDIAKGEWRKLTIAK